MKDYKRLTSEKGSVCDAEYCENGNCLSCAAQINYDRLAELEDKIESGEICDRKETAKEILSEIESYVKTVFKSNTPKTATLHDCIMSAKISALRKEYGIEQVGNSDKLE